MNLSTIQFKLRSPDAEAAPAPGEAADVAVDAVSAAETPRLVEPAPPAPPVPEKRIRWWKIALYAVILLLLGVGAVLLTDNVIMPWYVKLGDTQNVPNVVGMSYADAFRTLSKLGFEVKKGEPRFDEHYPAGVVVMQLPFGDSQTKKGRHVYLTLSRGAETIPVPDFIGMPLREARISAMRVGLEIGDAGYEYNDTVMKELVCSQSIPPGMGARASSVINLVVSRGSHTAFTMMPYLQSLSLEDAKTRLANAGLRLESVEFKDDPLYVPNTVIGQSLQEYTRVAEGTGIRLTVTRAGDSASKPAPLLSTPVKPPPP